MRLKPLDLADVHHVAVNMRDWDKREIYATRFLDDPLEVASDCMACPHFAWTAWGEKGPIAALGAVPMHPGVWTVWMFATDEFPAIGLHLTKFVKRGMIPALVKQNAHRAQCLSMAGHEEAHRWLRVLGARQEGSPLAGYGRNREDFLFFVWSN